MAEKGRLETWKQNNGQKLMELDRFTDCTFQVGEESNQDKIMAHKLVLSIASPVFEAMFYGAMSEKNDCIRILDMKPDVFKSLLGFIYTGIININNVDVARELYYGAHKYMLTDLVSKCSAFLKNQASVKNACALFEFAKIYEDKQLIDKCLKLFILKPNAVLKETCFEEIGLDPVIAMLSLNLLNVKNELDLFAAVEKYAELQQTEVGTVYNEEQTAGDQGSSEHRYDIKNKVEIRSALENIRFLTMTSKEFVEGPAKSPLLTKSEVFAVVMNIASNDSGIPMPDGWSTCRKPRHKCEYIEEITKAIETWWSTQNVNLKSFNDKDIL